MKTVQKEKKKANIQVRLDQMKMILRQHVCLGFFGHNENKHFL